MTRQSRIFTTLTEAFAPELLDVIDDSARHAGHAGASAEGETHYNIVIKSAAFAGQSRVSMQRAIMRALDEEFQTGLHALSIKASTI